MNTLYFTVGKHLVNVGDIEEASGWKTIYVYKIEDNVPKLQAEIEALNESQCSDEIQTWLDNNGDETEYTFTEL